MVYKILSVLQNSNSSKDYAKWNTHLDVVLTDNSWQQIWSSLMCTSSVQATRLQFFKLLNFWYVTPLTLHHIDNTCSPLCWTCHTTQGDYNHCWWDCSVVNTFGKVSTTLLRRNLAGISHFPKNLCFWIFGMMMLYLHPAETKWPLWHQWPAKTVIAWCFSGALFIEDWLTKLWDYYIMGKITYRLERQTGPWGFANFTARCKLIEFLQEKYIIPSKYDFIDLTVF